MTTRRGGGRVGSHVTALMPDMPDRVQEVVGKCHGIHETQIIDGNACVCVCVCSVNL